MFRKKKSAGLSVMHYTGLSGFTQDGPGFMSISGESVLFTNTSGATVTLPLTKVVSVEVMPEPNYMLKYHNSPASTAKVGAKWYGVFTYISDGEQKQIAIWFISPKISKVLYALQSRCAQVGGVTL